MELAPYFNGESHDWSVIHAAGMSISVALQTDLPGAKPSAVRPDLYRYPTAGGDIMPWGSDNNLPQFIVEQYSKDPIIPQSLGKVAAIILGRGIIPVEEQIDDNGDEKAIFIPDEEINQFVSSLDTKKYLREMAGDATWFFNGWPEMILSKDRKKIVQLHPLNAEECRWCRMTEAGDLPSIYLNANWPHARTEDPNTKQIAAIDPYRWDRVDWLRESSFFNCVYPISFPTPGKRFYSLPHHYSIIESGWLDVHLSVPAFKKYLMKNQMSIKYHIEVDKEYWELVYGDAWRKASGESKREMKQAWLTEMNKSLTNVEKAGNSLLTEVIWNQLKAEHRQYIKITVLEDKTKDGKYLADNVEAGKEIFYSLGLDPAISGFVGGDTQRSGGSDKREAYLIALQMLQPFRDMLLEPIEFAAEFNGWKQKYPKLKFKFKDTILTTLDTGAGTDKKLS